MYIESSFQRTHTILADDDKHFNVIERIFSRTRQRRTRKTRRLNVGSLPGKFSLKNENKLILHSPIIARF